MILSYQIKSGLIGRSGQQQIPWYCRSGLFHFGSSRPSGSCGYKIIVCYLIAEQYQWIVLFLHERNNEKSKSDRC